VKLLFRFAHLALHKIDNLLRLGDGAVFRQRANNYIRSIEKNDRRSDPFALGIRNDLPYASMCAIAEKVVPRSMPIALRVAISEKAPGGISAFSARFECSFHAEQRRQNAEAFFLQKETR
jgi:hypothetical protein